MLPFWGNLLPFFSQKMAKSQKNKNSSYKNLVNIILAIFVGFDAFFVFLINLEKNGYFEEKRAKNGQKKYFLQKSYFSQNSPGEVGLGQL